MTSMAFANDVCYGHVCFGLAQGISNNQRAGPGWRPIGMLDLIVGGWSSHTGDDYGAQGRQDLPMSEHCPNAMDRNFANHVRRSEMKTFKGMCVPICTPFVEGGEAVDEGALKAHIDWMIENGIHIILSCGGTGEFAYLRPAELRRITEVTAKHVAGRA